MDGCLRVRNLAGLLLLEMKSPASLDGLMQDVSKACRMPAELLKLVCDGTPIHSLEELEGISADVVELVAIVDETPCYTWDIEGNPDKEYLSGGGATVTFAPCGPDYVNVLSQVPISHGVHFVEFHMHSLQDEQWCGITLSKDRAGCRGGFIPGCLYYSGRRSHSAGSLDMPKERQHLRELSHVESGDVIGLLVDADLHVALFLLNGQFQGGCRIPEGPMYFCTALDVTGGTVELVRCSVEDFPVKLEDVIGNHQFVDETPAWPDENILDLPALNLRICGNQPDQLSHIC